VDDSEVGDPPPAIERPDRQHMHQHVEALRAFKRSRDQQKVTVALDDIARATNSKKENVFSKVISATTAGVTHGEVVSCLRRELGFGQPLIGK